MSLVLADRVQETTSTTGTGTLTLAGAVSGYQSFAAIGNGNTTYYAVVSDTDWEVGVGTYTASGTTLSRDIVLSSSAGGTTKISVVAGSIVFCDYPAGKAVFRDSVDNITVDKVTTTSIPVVLNDISNQFDFVKCVFPLKLNQTNITSSNFTDSKNLEVVVGGLRLTPYVKQITYPWLTPYDSHSGFRAVTTTTSASLIVYNAPARGDSASVTIINNSSSVQTRQYPYSATTIALGD
jgi:hypothetical protein